MSRSGYSYDCDNVQLWRGAVDKAIHGKRGQAFLRELLASLDALPEKKLIAEELENADGCVCAIGAVGKARGVDMSQIDYFEPGRVGSSFGISRAMAAEIEYVNDEEGPYGAHETDDARFVRVRAWVVSQIDEGAA